MHLGGAEPEKHICSLWEMQRECALQYPQFL